LSDEELAFWVQDAPDKAAYQKRLAIWLTHIGPFHAKKVADLLLISKQAKTRTPIKKIIPQN